MIPRANKWETYFSKTLQGVWSLPKKIQELLGMRSIFWGFYAKNSAKDLKKIQ